MAAPTRHTTLSTRPIGPVPPARPLGLARRQAHTGLAFLTPWIAGFLLLKLLPILGSLAFSFTDFDMLHPDQVRFVGLGNYLRVLGDGQAYFSLFATLGFALISIPVQIGLALFLAAALTSKRAFGTRAHRILVFMPSVIPGAAIFSLWLGFLDPSTGWLNRLILEPLGMPPYPGPNSESGYNFYLLIMALWSIGPGFLIMLGAMQAVPDELHEAARVDGAGPLMRFLSITVPIISPAIFFSLIINLISVFGGAALLDRSGALGIAPTSAYDAYVYQTMFGNSQLGYAATLAWVLFGAMLATTYFLFRTARYWVYYPEDDEGGP